MSTADWSGVSRRIRARRTELGISQQEAASRAGISVRVAAKYETEIPPSGPDLATLEKLARALDVSPAWLLYGVGEHSAEIGEAMLAQLRGLGVRHVVRDRVVGRVGRVPDDPAIEARSHAW